MSFQVANEAVRAAGRSMRSAGQQLAELKPHDAVADVPAALRGAASATTADTLCAVWRRKFSRLSAAVELHGLLLASDADDYELSDARVDRTLTGPPPGRAGRNVPEQA